MSSAQTIFVILANEPGMIIEAPYLIHEPIYFLMQRLAACIGIDTEDLSCHYLAINGFILEDDQKSLDYYRIMGGCLTYKYWMKYEMQLSVKTPTGSSIPVPCCLNDTIEYVKLIVEDMMGIPPDKQRLTFAGQELDNSHTLHEYAIRHEDTMLLEHPLRDNITMSSIRSLLAIIPFASTLRSLFGMTGYEQTVHLGATVMCLCNCTPDILQTVHLGFGLVELTKAPFTCPKCQRDNTTTPIKIVFKACHFRFMGIVVGSGARHVSEWYAPPEGSFSEFDCTKNPIWRRLLIQSRPQDENDVCIICLGSRCGVETFSCGHAIHNVCIERVRGYCLACVYDGQLGNPRAIQP